ncbi:DUF5959 family protein [Streptomyces sp. NPDC005727]|uniref:DUF5959 family protein n=1 Tax=Streptomyces sp. NPDC005727 TaxID=3157053 RepID=UPI00340BD5B1
MVTALAPPHIHLGPLLVAAPAITVAFAGARATALMGALAVAAQVQDLGDWAKALEELAAGRSVCWMTDLRNPEINIEFNTQFSVPVITVEDVRGSGTAMVVPVDLADGWVEAQGRRLEEVRRLPAPRPVVP